MVSRALLYSMVLVSLSPLIAVGLDAAGAAPLRACAAPAHDALAVLKGGYDALYTNVVYYQSVAQNTCGDENVNLEISIPLSYYNSWGEEPPSISLNYTVHSYKYYLLVDAIIGYYYEYYGYYELLGVGVSTGSMTGSGSTWWPCSCIGYEIISSSIEEPPNISGFDDPDSETVYVYSGVYNYTIKKMLRFCPDETIHREVGGIIAYLDKSGYEGGRPR